MLSCRSILCLDMSWSWSCHGHGQVLLPLRVPLPGAAHCANHLCRDFHCTDLLSAHLWGLIKPFSGGFPGFFWILRSWDLRFRETPASGRQMAEDYRWWWTSFSASGSSGIYVFLYSVMCGWWVDGVDGDGMMGMLYPVLFRGRKTWCDWWWCVPIMSEDVWSSLEVQVHVYLHHICVPSSLAFSK